jgi:hypothetical protein
MLLGSEGLGPFACAVYDGDDFYASFIDAIREDVGSSRNDEFSCGGYSSGTADFGMCSQSFGG